MPKRAMKYLVHDLTDLTQTIKIGQRPLLEYMGSIGVRINKNSLSVTSRPEPSELTFTDSRCHEIAIEGLVE